VSLACAMVERRLREAVIVGGSGDKAEVGGCGGWCVVIRMAQHQIWIWTWI
jgi:hypothetical protein